jgi:hypothetical protein
VLVHPLDEPIMYFQKRICGVNHILRDAGQRVAEFGKYLAIDTNLLVKKLIFFLTSIYLLF